VTSAAIRRGRLIEPIYICVGIATAIVAGAFASLQFGADTFNLAIYAVALAFLVAALILLLVEMALARASSSGGAMPEQPAAYVLRKGFGPFPAGTPASIIREHPNGSVGVIVNGNVFTVWKDDLAPVESAAIALGDEVYEALLPLIKWARTLNCASSRGYRLGHYDDVIETYRLRTGDVRRIGQLFDRRRDLYNDEEVRRGR